MTAAILVAMIRSVLLLAPVLALARWSRRAPAAWRHRLLATALVAHVIATLAAALPLPGWHLSLRGGAAPAAESSFGPVGAGAADGNGSAAATLPAESPASESRLPWLPGLWLAGAALLLFRLARSHAVARRLVARGRPVGVDGLPAGIRSVESSEVDSPFVYGARRPVLVLPTGWRGWSCERRGHVLRHEIAHIRRRDTLWGGAAEVIAALYWMSPVVWVALRALRLESERAADETVVDTGADPLRYASDLVGMASVRERSPLRVSAVGLAARRELEARVRGLLAGNVQRVHAARRAAHLGSLLFVLVAACSLRSGSGGEGVWLRLADGGGDVRLVEGRAVRVTGWGSVTMPRGSGVIGVPDGSRIEMDGAVARGGDVVGQGAVLVASEDGSSQWRIEPVASLPRSRGVRTEFTGPMTGHTRFEGEAGRPLMVFLLLDGTRLTTFVPE